MSASPVSRPTILVVEDEQDIRSLLTYNLEREGYHVLEAADGQSALDIARKRHPDLILLDLGLPDVDGIRLLRRIREWSRIPIIVVSTELDEVTALADRIMVMYRGRIVGIVPGDAPRDTIGLMMAGELPEGVAA